MATDRRDRTRGASRASRRSFLKAGFAGAAVLSGPIVWRRASAQTKRIVIRDPGGPFTVAFAEAFYKPFREATGVEAVGVAAAHEPTSQIKAIVESKSYTWDIALLSQAAADQLVKEGNYLEKHGLEANPDVSEIPKEFMSPYLVGNDVYSAVLAYRTDTFKGRKAPSSWRDLWDVKGFPGRRAIRKHPFDTVEEALLADGVPKDKVYPCDVDRAFRSLDKIKKDVAVWWTGGAQTSQLLKTGEVDICPTWNGRVQAAIDDGAPVAISWDQHLWSAAGWCIIRGTPTGDLCREFIKFAANAKRQAAYTPHLAEGPTNPNAYKYIAPERARMLPTHPEHYQKAVRVDYDYWGGAKDKVIERFNAWVVA